MNHQPQMHGRQRHTATGQTTVVFLLGFTLCSGCAFNRTGFQCLTSIKASCKKVFGTNTPASNRTRGHKDHCASSCDAPQAVLYPSTQLRDATASQPASGPGPAFDQTAPLTTPATEVQDNASAELSRSNSVTSESAAPTGADSKDADSNVGETATERVAPAAPNAVIPPSATLQKVAPASPTPSKPASATAPPSTDAPPQEEPSSPSDLGGQTAPVVGSVAPTQDRIGTPPVTGPVQMPSFETTFGPDTPDDALETKLPVVTPESGRVLMDKWW